MLGQENSPLVIGKEKAIRVEIRWKSFVASECFPLLKQSLADVVGSLPSELLKLGVDARCHSQV